MKAQGTGEETGEIQQPPRATKGAAWGGPHEQSHERRCEIIAHRIPWEGGMARTTTHFEELSASRSQEPSFPTAAVQLRTASATAAVLGRVQQQGFERRFSPFSES